MGGLSHRVGGKSMLREPLGARTRTRRPGLRGVRDSRLVAEGAWIALGYDFLGVLG